MLLLQAMVFTLLIIIAIGAFGATATGLVACLVIIVVYPIFIAITTYW